MLVSISPSWYGTLNPLPKSMKSKSVNLEAVSNKISAAYKKTSISRIWWYGGIVFSQY